MKELALKKDVTAVRHLLDELKAANQLNIKIYNPVIHMYHDMKYAPGNSFVDINEY